MPLASSTIRKALLTGALVVGTTAGAAGIAAAATSSSSNTGSGSASSPASAPSGGNGTPPANPATMTHGPNETLLTGTGQQKADAAATAAVPGATVIRAETDSSGAGTYEVHMKKADGSYVTVELDSSFKVIKTVAGFGGGPGGGQPPANGQAPSSSSSAASA
jgi:hypothetical protein